MAGLVAQEKRTFTLLASAARTNHSATGVKQYNRTYKGVRITIDISAFTGTSITFTLTGVDPVSGNSSGTILASAAKTGTGTFTLTVYPGITAASNVSVSDVLPSQWKLTSSGTITSATYSVHVEYLP